MSRSVQQALPPMEVKSLHRSAETRAEAVKELHQVPIQMAKASVGAAFAAAIGEGARKEYGHEGLVSAVCSGEKVPEYLARVYADPAARVRFGVAWLQGARKVRVHRRVVVDIEEG